jgi:hypothetical protein
VERASRLCLVPTLAGVVALVACASEHRSASGAAPCRLQKLRRVSFQAEVLAATVHQGQLAVLDANFTLHYDALAPDPGPVVSLTSLYPERAWDVALASTGADLALVSVSQDGFDLRLAKHPDQIAHLSVHDGTYFVRLAAGAGRLLAVARGTDPAVAWASFDGSWLGRPSFHPDELPTARRSRTNGSYPASDLAIS